MTKRADKGFLRAVLEPRKPGALQAIADACSAGADPNAICPESSTSSGPVRGGSTPLTHSIHEGSFKAVEKLLECGADPNRVDQNGWTPWMASTLVDDSKQAKIQEILAQYGAKPAGAHIGDLARGIVAGDVDRARDLIASDKDLEVLSTFRVDLVGHQIRRHNVPMLALLLERRMTPTATHLLSAIRSGNAAAVDLLLRHGLVPERPAESETPLMTAAAMGNMQIVQRLVAAGADVNRSADENNEWTAAFYARQAGQTDIADWLDARMSDEAVAKREQLAATRDAKYARLYEQATASETLSTDNIVEILSRWDVDYGVTLSDASNDSLNVKFSSLPEELDRLYGEIIRLSPDAADEKRSLLKELKKNKTLFLWWD